MRVLRVTNCRYILSAQKDYDNNLQLIQNQILVQDIYYVDTNVQLKMLLK